MSNWKHKLPIWFLGILVMIGNLVAWFFWGLDNLLRNMPERYEAEFYAVIHGDIAKLFGILLLDIPIAIAWLKLMFGKDELKPRLHWFWTPFGLLMAVWGWLTYYGATAIEEGERITVLSLLSSSPEIWRSTAVGLLFAFYCLGSAKLLWPYYWTWAWAGIIMPLAELPKLFGAAGVPWSPYFAPEQAGMFWHTCGFALLDAYIIPLAPVVFFYIFEWRKSELEKEGERHIGISAFLETIGLWWVLLWRAMKHSRFFRRYG
ncbi:MAG: hypothetical protein FJ010_06505 [Chloroflexi bacterium]|nr:hypothetical protein [Chloroflexota bacterium]